MNVLARIAARKREEVRARERARPADVLRTGLVRSGRDLEAALRAPHAGYVLECKRASPSAGALVTREAYDPAGIAAIYAPFADAVSVLTDEVDFGGSYADLAAVRRAIDLPILAKDVVVAPYQVLEARAAGADAVLLMLSVLDDAAYAACHAVAMEWGMHVVCEVHDELELARATRLGARIVGINNRDLTTLAIDLATTEALAPRVAPGVVVIGESGIAGRADALRLRDHTDALLVGSHLSRAPSVAHAVRELVFGRAKVCGLAREEDAVAAWEAGATWGGFVLAEGSPRRVSIERAREIARAAPLWWVAVATDTPVERLAALAADVPLAAVQLAGPGARARAAALRANGLAGGCEVWVTQSVVRAAELEDEPHADRVVLDTRKDGLDGGTGARFDWSGLEGDPRRERVVLAGGIDGSCAARAVATGCWALDASSRLESAPGVKDRAKLRALFAALRGRGRAT